LTFFIFFKQKIKLFKMIFCRTDVKTNIL